MSENPCGDAYREYVAMKPPRMIDAVIDAEIERWYIQPGVDAFMFMLDRWRKNLTTVQGRIRHAIFDGPRLSDYEIDLEIMGLPSGRSGMGIMDGWMRIVNNVIDCSSYAVAVWSDVQWELNMVHVIE